MDPIANHHKEKGNLYFRSQEYSDAIAEYTKAIIKDPSNVVYYSNRAICYYKLGKYDEMISDSERAIELAKASGIANSSFKGLYYLGLGQTELGLLTQAETNLMEAYKIALAQNSPSASAICQAILQVRKKKWDAKEEKRLANESSLLAELKGLLKEKLDREIIEAQQKLPEDELEDEKEYLNHEYEEKLNELSTIFARADHKYEKKEVPDYLLDPISFNLFVDPVISKSGQTFERSWILQHLKTSRTDPFSRQPLSKDDLIPNLQLKAAAEEFMKKEGTF